MIKNFFKTNNIEYLEEVSLKKYNTYHIDTLCAYLAFPKNKEELIIILKELTKGIIISSSNNEGEIKRLKNLLDEEGFIIKQ